MKGYLLDANLLIALAWPNHAQHATAHAWLAKSATEGWGTCSLTQLAFVRISSHPSVALHVSTQEALQTLRQILAMPQHRFWPEPPGGFAHPSFARTSARILSHGLVTDAYLVTVALFNSGKLASLDQQLVRSFPESTVLVSE